MHGSWESYWKLRFSKEYLMTWAKNEGTKAENFLSKSMYNKFIYPSIFIFIYLFTRNWEIKPSVSKCSSKFFKEL